MRGRRIAWAAALFAALLCLLLWLYPARVDVQTPIAPPSTSAAGADSAPAVGVAPDSPPRDDATSTAAPEAAGLALLDRWTRSSLRGSGVDGAARRGADGRLLHDLALRQLFEYFLSLTGEFAPADIRRLLALHLEADGDVALAADALAAFDRYLGLRRELGALPPAGDLRERLETMEALQRDWFGADAEAMFGADNAHTRYTLDRLDILRDASLEESERARRLADLDARRPPADRAAEQASLSAILAEEQTRQLVGSNADAADRQAERSALWGDEAAERLAALDQAREVWDQRLADYAAARARLLGDTSLTEAARQRALNDLLERNFHGPDRVRVESLQAIGALPGG